MNKRVLAILSAIIWLSILFIMPAFADELKSMALLDDSPEVLELKKTLISLGYLDKANETSLFDRPTKSAIETLQNDFNLEPTGIASPEIQVICSLLLRLQNNKVNSAEVTATPAPQHPNIFSSMDAEYARKLLEASGYIVVEKIEYSSTVAEKKVIRCYYDSNNIANLVVSGGEVKLFSKNSTWYAWWIKGSKRDQYSLGDIYIDQLNKNLHIELEATLNSSIPHKWRGYGTAAINDVFDKVVPIDVKYENEIIKKGKKQKIELIIPLSELNVDRPTTISVKIEMYRGNDYKTEESLRMDFTMTW